MWQDYPGESEELVCPGGGIVSGVLFGPWVQRFGVLRP